MIKFYYSTATCSTASHIALREAGMDFAPFEVSWQRNINVEELAKVSSLGAVPALVLESGHALTQNAAILEYIADSNPTSHLLAKAGSIERAETMSWVSFAGADIQKWFTPILGAKNLTTIEAARAEMRVKATEKLTGFLQHVEKNLEGKDYIMGQNFTVADAYLFTVLGWYKWAEIKTLSYKNVQSYMKRVYERPAVKKVLEAEGLLDYLQ